MKSIFDWLCWGHSDHTRLSRWLSSDLDPDIAGDWLVGLLALGVLGWIAYDLLQGWLS